MWNFRVTPSYKLKQREGITKIFALDPGKVQGMWYGKIGGTTFFLFAQAGHLWSGDLVAKTKTDLGTLTDAPTNIFYYRGKVYIQNGAEYKYFDGLTFDDVAGYRPKLYVDTPPAGGGTAYEEINLLNGLRHQTFSPDGAATEYVIAEANVDSFDFVKNIATGVTYTSGVDYTEDKVNGKITFSVAPITGTPSNIDIGWTKGTGQRSDIVKHKFATIVNAHVFLYGHPDNINRANYSMVADTIPSAEYFAANSYIEVGSGRYALTGIDSHFSTVDLFTEGSAWYTIPGTTTLADGRVVPDYPIYSLNGVKGNIAPGQVQIIRNNPITIQDDVYEWVPRDVAEETNAIPISQRVKTSLDAVDRTTAITYDYEEKQEYWLCVGDIAWIYNYGNGTWYKFNNVSATCFLVIDGEMYFGKDGAIMKFDESVRYDDGNLPVNSYWEMGFYAFGAEYLKKYMINMYISLLPEQNSSVDVQIVTDNDGTSDKQAIYYRLATFEHMDFEHFGFETSYNPQPFPLDVQAMGFVYFKVILSNSELENTVTVLAITLPARLGGKV